MSYTPSLHFYPNACAVCKRFGKEVQLKKCKYCRTISYCSDEHQQKNWSEHKEICTAIEAVNSQWELYRIGDKTLDSNVPCNNWLWTKRKFAILVALRLGRQPTPYEIEMLEFPPICVVCHSKENLYNCINCASVSYCSKHREVYKSRHNQEICDFLKQCYYLDSFEMKLPSLKYVSMIKYESFKGVHNMETFLTTFLLYYTLRSQKKNLIITADLSALHSELVTRPLTLFFALQKISGKIAESRYLDIHVIASNHMEATTIAGWEILLHLMPYLQILKVILIGPELEEISHDAILCQPLCDNCTYCSKMFIIEYHTCVYEDYKKNKLYKDPRVIVGFNAHLHAYDKELVGYTDTWSETVRIIRELSCPFILTCHTAKEGRKDLNKLKDILMNVPDHIYADKNPFASMRPNRHTEQEATFFKNEYLIVFESLFYKVKITKLPYPPGTFVPHLSFPEVIDEGQGPSKKGSDTKQSTSTSSGTTEEPSSLTSDPTSLEHPEVPPQETSDTKSSSREGSADSGRDTCENVPDTKDILEKVSEAIEVICIDSPTPDVPTIPPTKDTLSGDEGKDQSEGTSKEGTSKEGTSKEETSKEEISEEETSEEGTFKEETSKEGTSKKGSSKGTISTDQSTESKSTDEEVNSGFVLIKKSDRSKVIRK